MADLSDSTPMTEISRPIVEAEIELLIALLDTLDPDPDLEDGADIEADSADEEDGGDDEWELGWTAVQAQTGRYNINWNMPWAVLDGEPSLAAPNRLNQSFWWQGGRDDREEDPDLEDQCEDEGAQCEGEGEGNGLTYN